MQSTQEHGVPRHPIWDWLASGSYSLEKLQSFALLYYGHIREFRKYLAGAITVSTIEQEQVEIAAILAEEYGVAYHAESQSYGPSHPDLYRSYAVDRAERRRVGPRLGYGRCRRVQGSAFRLFQSGREVETMGALVFGMESSTPYRHERVTTGLRDFAKSNGTDVDTTFFSRHVEIDSRHGRRLITPIRHC